MKKIILIFMIIPAICLGQDWGKFKPVANKNEQFGQGIKKWGVVLCIADTSWYIITDLAYPTDSLQTFIRQGKYYKNSSGDNADSKWESSGSDIYYSAGKVSIGSSAPPDSTLKVTGGVNVTRGLKTGYDIKVNGVTVGKGSGAFTGNTALGESALSNNSATGKYNTAIGYQSLTTNTTGDYNTALGYQALKTANEFNNTAIGYKALTASTGGDNTAVGGAAMQSNSTGSLNAAVGTAALFANTSGGNNTGVGCYSLQANTTGNSNTSLGFKANFSNTTGFSNTAVGVSALYSNTTASNLVAVGDSALYSNTTGGQNTAVGSKALRKNTTASSSTAFGYMALTNSTGANNTGIGNEALYTNTTGTMNTAIGDGALKLQSTATRNTAVGFGSLYSSTGGANTAVGSLTLRSNTTGQSNIALGDSAGYSYTTLSNRMYLGARDSSTTGIFFNRTTGINKGYWNGKLNIKTVPYSAAATLKVLAQDTTTGDVYRTAVTGGGGTTIDTTTILRSYCAPNIGDILYTAATSTPECPMTPLAIGSPGQVLGVVNSGGSNIPQWQTPSTYDTTANPWKYQSGNTVQRGTGNVGIGTTNPTALLFIENASQGAIIRNNSTVSIPAGSGTYNLSQLDLLHNGTTGVFARQVLRYNRTTSRYEFMQSFRNAAGGALNVQYLDLDNGSYQIQSGVTNMDFQNTGNVTFSNSGSVGIATTSPSTYLDINGNKFRLRTAKTPSSSTDTGNAGDICWDASYIYICTATNTWKRVAISTW